MEQIINIDGTADVAPEKETEASSPITLAQEERHRKHGISGVLFMQIILTVSMLLAAAAVNIIDSDLFEAIMEKLVGFTNRETEEIFISIIDYFRSFSGL